MQTFEEAKSGVTTKQYDYLDHRNAEFDKDFENFMEQTDTLKESIGNCIEQNFSSVWETPQGIKFLVRFEKVLINILWHLSHGNVLIKYDDVF